MQIRLTDWPRVDTGLTVGTIDDQSLQEMGLDPRDNRVSQTILMAATLQGMPRHMGFIQEDSPYRMVPHRPVSH